MEFSSAQNTAMENTSGHGPAATVPAQIDKWNWGAFLLNWIWGIGNNIFIALLMFIPLVNLVMPFVLGVKGSAWAWRNKRWDSVEEFQRIQRKWTQWALIIYALLIAFFVALVFLIGAGLKNSDIYRLALAQLEANAEVAAVIGKPISSGAPMGSIEIAGPSGKANFSFAVSGPKGKGTVYLEATKRLGQWQIENMVLELDGSGRRIDLGNNEGTVARVDSEPYSPLAQAQSAESQIGTPA